jgi:phosphonopyruvate decarboxylase
MNKEKAPFALLVRKQTFEPFQLKDNSGFLDSSLLHREEVLEKILDAFPDDPLVTTTGFTSREVFELRVAKKQSHAHDFLTVGSMGHCSSIALGIALAKPEKQVLAVDGDGAAIMHLGAFATAGKSENANFKHVLVNNAIHDSVGGQPTGCDAVDFPAIALASGYKAAEVVSAPSEIEAALQRLRDNDGPRFLEIRVRPGARSDLGRPTTTPIQNRDGFMEMLAAP